MGKTTSGGIGFGCALAIAISYTTNKSILWAILHGIFSFLAAPPEDKILCARCEAIAVANGLPSAAELAGRHVHVGRTVAVMTCCGK